MKFINDCIKAGITIMADIKKEAKRQLLILEKEIAELDEQRKEKYTQFKEIGAFLKQSEDGKPSPTVVMKTSWQELTPDMQTLCLDIIAQFETQSNFPATKITSQILDLDKRKKSITLIKWLIDQKILSRVGNDIIRGTTWETRKDILGDVHDQ